MTKNKGKVGMISLGCCKNQVDAERMLAKLVAAGYTLCTDIAKCDAVLVNTCGFIEAAKQEAIDTILETAQYKQSGKLRVLGVTGCLAERYREQVADQFPEADLVLGIGKNEDIVSLLDRALAGERVVAFGKKTDLSLEGERILANDSYFAYVKIAEGCSNCCSYCAIPMIRGAFRSRPMDNIVKEVEGLVVGGAKEIVLVAQDTSRYGEDLFGESRLPELLEAVCAIPGDFWVRILYCYPERITDRLLDVMAAQPKVCKYIDLPLQHGSGKVLKDMKRHGDRESLLALLAKIRARIPGVVIRTTMIAGFPTETQEDFAELCMLVEQGRFERLGCFAYSQEENTPAGALEQLDMELRARRAEIVMEIQASIAFDCAASHIGETLRVLVEGFEDDHYIGRSYMDAPDIDPKVLFLCARSLTAGDMIEVTITDSNEYDLIGYAAEDANEPTKGEGCCHESAE